MMMMMLTVPSEEAVKNSLKVLLAIHIVWTSVNIMMIYTSFIITVIIMTINKSCALAQCGSCVRVSYDDIIITTVVIIIIIIGTAIMTNLADGLNMGVALSL